MSKKIQHGSRIYIKITAKKIEIDMKRDFLAYKNYYFSVKIFMFISSMIFKLRIEMQLHVIVVLLLYANLFQQYIHNKKSF
jgi:hypothetical protein